MGDEIFAIRALQFHVEPLLEKGEKRASAVSPRWGLGT